jgi:hypothetical protein
LTARTGRRARVRRNGSESATSVGSDATAPPRIARPPAGGSGRRFTRRSRGGARRQQGFPALQAEEQRRKKHAPTIEQKLARAGFILRRRQNGSTSGRVHACMLDPREPAIDAKHLETPCCLFRRLFLAGSTARATSKRALPAKARRIAATAAAAEAGAARAR